MEPEILSARRGTDAVLVRLRVPPSLQHFRDHFPGLPILPGVVQVDWAVRIARQHFAGLEVSRGMDAFKCHAPVQPGAELQLRLSHDAARGALQFQYRNGQRPVCSGTVLFRL